ncbi:MAG: hypothetical protein V3V09_08755 [Arenicellales bacterium]
MKLIISLALLSQPTWALDIPLQLDQWQTLTYKSIPPNTTTQLEDSLVIDVSASASPLIYVLDSTQTIKYITVTGNAKGLPAIPNGLKQGDKGADDFPFRIGLVLAGDQTLGFAQKLIAADWIKTLFKLAPKGSGIDHVKFLNLKNSDASTSWQSRSHPSSKGLFQETIVGSIEDKQTFNLNHQLDEAAEVIALWISIDGDDTNSTYQLILNSISLN